MFLLGSFEETRSGFFSKLYSINYFVSGVLPCHGAFPSITQVARDRLSTIVSIDEIRRAIFGMSPLKAPRLDGFHLKFYQSNWDIVGLSICYFFRRILEG